MTTLCHTCHQFIMEVDGKLIFHVNKQDRPCLGSGEFEGRPVSKKQNWYSDLDK